MSNNCMNITYIYHFVLLLWLLENGNLKKNEQAGTFTDCMGLLLWIYWPYLQECHSSTMWSLVVKQKRWVFFCSIQKQQWWLTVRKLPCPMKLSSPHFLQLHNAVARKWFWDVKWNLCQKKKKKVIFQCFHHFTPNRFSILHTYDVVWYIKSHYYFGVWTCVPQH